MSLPSEAPIAVLGAMEAEVSSLVAAMTGVETGTAAGMQYWAGELAGRRVVVGRCGMGKVAAAAGVQHLIDAWAVQCVVVCGLAGGLADDLTVGDIVIGERFVQYDMDASPLVARFEIPGLGMSELRPSAGLASVAEAVAIEVAAELAAMPGRGERGAPRVRRGLIATGDTFVKDDQRHAIRRDFPEALCVDMEGGALAQVCLVNDVDLVVVRVISDSADGEAPGDFMRFLNEEAPRYTAGIVWRLLPALP